MSLGLFFIYFAIVLSAFSSRTLSYESGERSYSLKPHERRDPKEWLSKNITFGLSVKSTLKNSKENDECSKNRIRFMGMNWKIFEEDLKAMNITLSSANAAGIFEQNLDHFNKSDDRKFDQHFLYNTDATNNSVNFLHIGGEGHISPWMLAISYMKYGEQIGANLYVLEHRYYGESQPFSGHPNVDMQYLSSEQALTDTAVFIRSMNAKRNITNPKWIVFGGSYPGNLAAWMRQKYSDLVIGAIATSAPVQAQLDFRGYWQVVAKAFEDYGTKNCTNDIRRYFSKAQTLLLTEDGRKRLGYNDPFSFLDYNLPNIQGDDLQHNMIKAFCEDYRKKADDISHPNKTFVCDRSRYDTTNGTVDWHTAWDWQTCTEFGYYQTISPDGGIFDDATLSLRSSVKHYCTDLFPNMTFTESSIQAAINKTNSYYGGNKNFNATNVVFINGSEDPWHPLSLYDTPNDSVKSILVQGAAHCSDFIPDQPSDPEPMKNARERVRLEIANWLGIKA